MAANIETKVCTRCRREKRAAEFSPSARHSTGLVSRCKLCNREVTNAYQATPQGALRLCLRNMIGRCHDPRNASYADYGGRGIRVHQGWRDHPEAFVEYALANGWAAGLQIDRIDNNGSYEPGNVRFVSRIVNNRNRRRKTAARSRFKGVVHHPINKRKQWRARLTVEGRSIHLGCFETEEEAARAYDTEARKHEGYSLNFPA